MKTSESKVFSKPARDVKRGDTLMCRGLRDGVVVERVMICSDGSIRLVHARGDSRMTPMMAVRILH